MAAFYEAHLGCNCIPPETIRAPLMTNPTTENFSTFAQPINKTLKKLLLSLSIMCDCHPPDMKLTLGCMERKKEPNF